MTPPADDDKVRRPVRWFVATLLGLLVLFAAIDVEMWPMTGWRLFSTIRDETQTGWVAEATDAQGNSRIVSYEELPLGYRNAAWRVADIRDASSDEREAVCNALLEAIVKVEPETTTVRLARDRAKLEKTSGEPTVTHDLETLHTCGFGSVS